jgi:hypothetical protein
VKNRTLLFVALWVCWAAQPAQATTLVRMTLEQLSQASSAIIRGRVVSQESRWNPEHTRIMTFTTIALVQTLKGHPPSTLVIEQPGGKVGEIHVFVAGTVRFHLQTDYVLFLEPSSADSSRFLLVGMVQGACRIYRDAATGQECVILPLGFLSRAAQRTGPGSTVAGPTLPLSELRQQLATALATPVAIPRGTSISLAIRSTESEGVGRAHVVGRTTSDIFPSSGVVVPAGSLIEGTAQRISGTWRIYWTEISVRGTRVPISATSEEPAGSSLRGRMLVISVR